MPRKVSAKSGSAISQAVKFYDVPHVSFYDEMRAKTEKTLLQEIEDAESLVESALDGGNTISDIIVATKTATLERANLGEYNAYISCSLPLWEGAGTSRMQRVAIDQMRNHISDAIVSHTGLKLVTCPNVHPITICQSVSGTWSVVFSVTWADE